MTGRRASGWRPWPQSLAGQLMLVAALALLLAQGVNFSLLLAGRDREAEAQATYIAGARIGLALEGRGPGIGESERGVHRGIGRLPLRVRVGGDEWMEGKRLERASERAEAVLGELDENISAVEVRRMDIAALPAGLGFDRARRFMGGREDEDGLRPRDWHEAVVVSVHLENGRIIEASAPLRPRERGTLGWLIAQTLILYLAVLLPLALFGWTLGRPLSRLTQSARRFSGSGEVEWVPEKGPADIRRLIGAVNAMQTRVANMIGEKDVMLGAIGHDLKTPLASLRLRLETLDLAEEDEAEREKMVATVEELHAMLDDILTLARLGRSSEAAERTDLSALLSALAADYAERGAPVSFDEEAARKIAPVPLRPLLVRRALRNLIDNAVLYGGEAHLSLSLGEDHARIHIADNGPGIPDEQLGALFEPFRRAEASRNRQTGGSGLGLTIARAIARAHGGDVTLANEPGGGLVATLVLPLA